ncbi:hypothetical protein BZM26_36575 [Paraburkholderia strydomiana]|nr:hypothetical protein BZM26_36575 [Paraburkholderia strydomiana]
MKIIELVRSILPEGTERRFAVIRDGEVAFGNDSDVVSWDLCPAWPPDLFAVAATLVERTSCYTLAGPDPDASKLAEHIAYVDEVEQLASQWTRVSTVPDGIASLWTRLITEAAEDDISSVCDNAAVVDLLIRLFAIADEACKGMGWSFVLDSTSSNDEDEIKIADLVRASFLRDSTSEVGLSLPYVPLSLCSLVPMDVAIVFPKSMTAAVGCTVRSLSHHLALLPGSTQIEPSWRMADRNSTPDTKKPELMRLLVIPYPFNIPDESFYLSREPLKLRDCLFTAAFFGLEQAWLSADAAQVTAEKIVDDLIRPLLLKARQQSRGESIDGVLFPECALSAKLGTEVAKLLVGEGIEFFITGALGEDEEGKSRNIAQTHVVVRAANGDTGLVTDEQSKHHRWRLDDAQVNRYALTFPDLATASHGKHASQWWEDIDITHRNLPFYALRQDMSLAVLICEDLARNDPAMTVIRAVGPNLVVALLMDGPQLGVRWPARYATVLADDPGSSVLSITCAAMVDRSNWRESRPVRSIGLWRDAKGYVQELNLPVGSHGLLLTLNTEKDTQHTLDNRSDRESTRRLTLKSVIPLALDTGADWL